MLSPPNTNKVTVLSNERVKEVTTLSAYYGIPCIPYGMRVNASVPCVVQDDGKATLPKLQIAVLRGQPMA